MENGKDNVIALSYDNNIFIQAIGIELVRAHPMGTWENALVVPSYKNENNKIHLVTTQTQNYALIVRVYYQNPNPA